VSDRLVLLSSGSAVEDQLKYELAKRYGRNSCISPQQILIFWKDQRRHLLVANPVNLWSRQAGATGKRYWLESI